MRTGDWLVVTAVFALANLACSCKGTEGRIYGGYFQSTVTGEMALDSSAGGLPLGTNRNDIEDDFGITDSSPSLWLRGEIEPPKAGRFTLSGFHYESSGTGTLSRRFGDIQVGAPVDTDLRFDNLKATWTWDILEGDWYRLAPGIAVDVFAIDTKVRSSSPVVASEEVDILAPVPMIYLQGSIGTGIIALDLEGGWMKADLNDIDAEFLDLEAMLRLKIGKGVELLGGYRYIRIDGEGIADGRRFETDLQLNGWFAGAGYNF